MAYRQIETDKERQVDTIDAAQLQQQEIQSQRNDLVNLPVDPTKKDALLKVFDTMSSKMPQLFLEDKVQINANLLQPKSFLADLVRINGANNIPTHEVGLIDIVKYIAFNPAKVGSEISPGAVISLRKKLASDIIEMNNTKTEIANTKTEVHKKNIDTGTKHFSSLVQSLKLTDLSSFDGIDEKSKSLADQSLANPADKDVAKEIGKKILEAQGISNSTDTQQLNAIIKILALQTQQRQKSEDALKDLDPTTPEYAKAVETYTTNHEAALRSYDAMGIVPPFPREISVMRTSFDRTTDSNILNPREVPASTFRNLNTADVTAVVNQTDLAHTTPNPETSAKINDSLTKKFDSPDSPEAKAGLNALSGVKNTLSDENVNYIHKVITEHYKQGESVSDFLTRFEKTQPEVVSFLQRFDDATQALLFDGSTKSPEQIRTLLTPRNPEAETAAKNAITQTFHEVARTTAVQSFLKTVVDSMDYALGASSTLAGVHIDTPSIKIGADGSFSCGLISSNRLINQEIRVSASGEVQMTDFLDQGNEGGKSFTMSCHDLGIKIPSINSMQTLVMDDLTKDETLTTLLSDPSIVSASTPEDARKALRSVCLARESVTINQHITEQMGGSQDMIKTVVGHQLSANHKTERMFELINQLSIRETGSPDPLLDKFVRGQLPGGIASTDNPTHFRFLNMIQNSSNVDTPEANMMTMDRAIDNLSSLITNMDANNGAIDDPLLRKYLYNDPKYMDAGDKSSLVKKSAMMRMMGLFDTFRYGPDTDGTPAYAQRNVMDSSMLANYTDFVKIDSQTRGETRTFADQLATSQAEKAALGSSENLVYKTSQNKLREKIIKEYSDQINREQKAKIEQKVAIETKELETTEELLTKNAPDKEFYGGFPKAQKEYNTWLAKEEKPVQEVVSDGQRSIERIVCGPLPSLFDAFKENRNTLTLTLVDIKYSINIAEFKKKAEERGVTPELKNSVFKEEMIAHFLNSAEKTKNPETKQAA